MVDIYITATIWFFLALISTILASKLKVSMALVEICIGALAGYTINKFFSQDILHTNSDWIKFIASCGAIILTFLAGAELDPESFKSKLKEASIVGFMGFFAPFVGCSLITKYLLNWSLKESLLAGIALSTTSMAVVYAVMLEYGFNKTEFGKGILSSCFINDLGTVIALGLIFAPFNYKTIIFVVVSLFTFVLTPRITEFIVKEYANKTAAIRTKWILFLLFSLGALALWSGSEAVLPAYILGMVLSGVVGRDNFFIRRIRTLTIGFLTPIYFLRAGSFVSIPAVLAAPLVFLTLFLGKVLSKIFGLYLLIRHFRNENKKESVYYTLLMSTGLTFGTISAIYGLNNKIITQQQYSYLVAVVIASAVVPTLIANKFFLPTHILDELIATEEEESPEDKIK